MAQQPHPAITRAELPTHDLAPPPAKPWAPVRPGDSVGSHHPSGPAFGRPGPNTGYALRLVAAADIPDTARRHEVETVVGTIAGFRAARAGRGPIMADVRVALALLGFGVDADDEALAERRSAILDDASHEHAKGWGFVTGLPESVVLGDPAGAAVHVARSLRGTA